MFRIAKKLRVYAKKSAEGISIYILFCRCNADRYSRYWYFL